MPSSPVKRLDRPSTSDGTYFHNMMSCFYPIYFISTSEKLILLGCYHCPCPQTSSLNSMNSTSWVTPNYQIRAVCDNTLPRYPFLLFWQSNKSNDVNKGPECFCQVSLFSDIWHPCYARWIFRISRKTMMDVMPLKRVIIFIIIYPNKPLTLHHVICGQMWWGFETHNAYVTYLTVHWCIWQIKLCQIHFITGTHANR